MSSTVSRVHESWRPLINLREAESQNLVPWKVSPIALALSGRANNTDRLLITRDREVIAVELWARPIIRQERVRGALLVLTDITDRRRRESHSDALNRTKVLVSRDAGRSEVAAGILHNIGNVINGASVADSMAKMILSRLKLEGLRGAGRLLATHQDDMAHFLELDQRGSRLPEFLSSLGEHSMQIRAQLDLELDAILDRVDHVKRVIGSYQRLSTTRGCFERIPVGELIDESVTIVRGDGTRGLPLFEVERFTDIEVVVDRSKISQILVNLLINARDATLSGPKRDAPVVIRVDADEAMASLRVIDRGVGITKDDLRSIFSYGYTTKGTGRGIGLHISAIAATENNGNLRCHSEGRNSGATFILALPRYRATILKPGRDPDIDPLRQDSTHDAS